MSAWKYMRWKRAAAAVLMLAAVPALDCARCSTFSLRATRFVEEYQKAPEIGVIGKVALGLMKSSPRKM